MIVNSCAIKLVDVPENMEFKVDLSLFTLLEFQISASSSFNLFAVDATKMWYADCDLLKPSAVTTQEKSGYLLSIVNGFCFVFTNNL